MDSIHRVFHAAQVRHLTWTWSKIDFTKSFPGVKTCHSLLLLSCINDRMDCGQYQKYVHVVLPKSREKGEWSRSPKPTRVRESVEFMQKERSSRLISIYEMVRVSSRCYRNLPPRCMRVSDCEGRGKCNSPSRLKPKLKTWGDNTIFFYSSCAQTIPSHINKTIW